MMMDLWKSESDWFARWFNTEAYHVLYEKRDDVEAKQFVERLVNQLFPSGSGSGSKKILDLGCGAGRHSIQFGLQGHSVIGLDLSQNSIETAQKNTESFPNVSFLKGDMRELQKIFPANSFHVVVSLFTSLGYFESFNDLQQTLDGIHHVMRDEGIFVLDFLHVHHVKSTLVPHEQIFKGGYQFNIHRRIVEGWIEKSIQYEVQGEEYHFVERVQAISEKEWEVLFQSVGWEIVNRFGDYSLNPLMEESPRCILVARKMPCG